MHSLVPLLTRFADRCGRDQAAQALARYWGADALFLFIPDPELGSLRLAPGFAGTLPGGSTWREFLIACSQPGEHHGTIAYPDRNSLTSIHSFVYDDRTVLALIGGNPTVRQQDLAAIPFKLVTALLQTEAAHDAAIARTAAASDATRRATALAAALDRARAETEAKAAELQQALAESARLNRQLRELNNTLEQRVEERTRELRQQTDERLKVEAALLQAQKMEAVGQLTGGVAHDFNNLLSVIISSLDMIESLSAGNPKLQRVVGMAQRAANRGARLTEQLLAFSRRQVLRPQILDINELLQEYQDLLRRAVGEAIEIRLDLHPEPCPCHIDPVHFEAALLNLAVNARDATQNGGVITIRTEPGEGTANSAVRVFSEEYVSISITDTGTGIPKDILDRVFEPFFTTKPAGKGTGLGLSQVYGFVEQSGGRLAIKNAPGHGTMINIYLPLARMEPVRMGSEPAEEGNLSGGTELILVVEDDADVSALVLDTLEALGYETLAAHTGPEALDIIRKRPDIELLFSDLVMPGGMTGTELARAARKLRPGLKVLLTSGYVPHAGNSDDGREDGFPLLLKPYQPRELAKIVRSILEGSISASVLHT